VGVSDLPELAYPPRLTSFTRPFWEELDAGRLTTTRCRACRHLTFPPRLLCPDCWGRDVEWTGLSGHGILRSFTEVWSAPGVFAAEVPYVLGLVDLEEGIRCLARIDARYDDLRVDQPMVLAVRRARPVSLFEFRPG
jgi:uncharacterized protein